jgi:hypothetical protein
MEHSHQSCVYLTISSRFLLSSRQLSLVLPLFFLLRVFSISRDPRMDSHRRPRSLEGKKGLWLEQTGNSRSLIPRPQ